MRIISIYANMSKVPLGLFKVKRRIYDILSELEVEITEFDLKDISLKIFDGKKDVETQKILEEIKSADGIIFATSVSLFSPCALMHNFLNYLEDEKTSLIEKKHCLLLSVSPKQGEKTCIEYMSDVVNFFGGFDSVKIGINEKIALKIDENEDTKETLEKQIEDFYRFVRQGRKFFIPKDNVSETIMGKTITPFEPEVINSKVDSQNNNSNLSLNEFNDEYSKDIDEITQFFVKKYTSDEEENTIYEDKEQFHFDNFNSNVSLKPRETTIKQFTQTLPYRFRKHVFQGEDFVLQLSITGEESFSCYLKCSSYDCSFSDGQSSSPDISIFSNVEVWKDILKGKKTIQKAFMTGQIKVKGNFVLISSLDKLFEPIK